MTAHPAPLPGSVPGGAAEPGQGPVAFLGLGHMGLPMARNLAAAGFTVRAWNRTPARMREIEGAEPAGSPRAAAAGARWVVTMLADDAAVGAVAFGPDGILAGMGEGAVHVGMSTVSVALARRLAEAHAAAGQGYVAAPVFGRPAAAAARQLAIVAGGPAAEVERCRPLFAALGRAVHVVGDAPQASLAKLVGNYLIAATTQALGEALTLAEKGGIDPERMLALLVGSGFGSPIVERYGALVARTEFEPSGFPVRLGFKDVGLALAAGAELQVPMPIAGLARDRLLSAMAHGWAEDDFAALAGVIREAAGLPARRDASAAAAGSPS